MRDLVYHLLLELLNRHKYRVNFHIFDRVFGHFTFQNHTLLFIFLINRNAIFFEILDDHRDAVV